MKINKLLESKKLRESDDKEVIFQKGNKKIIKDGYGYGIEDDNSVTTNRFYVDGKGEPKFEDGTPAKFWLDKVNSLIKSGKITGRKNEGYSHFEFTSGANPYIAKTKDEAERIKRSRGDSAHYVGSINGIDYYKVDDSEEDLFRVDESKQLNETEYGKDELWNQINNNEWAYNSLANKVKAGIKNGTPKERIVYIVRNAIASMKNDFGRIPTTQAERLELARDFVEDELQGYSFEDGDPNVLSFKRTGTWKRLGESFKPSDSGIQSVKCYNRYNYTIQELRVDNDNKTFERGNFTAGKADKKTKNRQEFEDVVDTLKELGYTEIKSDYRSMRNKSRKGNPTSVEEGYELSPRIDYNPNHLRDDEGKIMADRWYASKWPDDEVGIEQLQGLTLDDALKDRSILGHCDTQVRERVYAQLDKYIPLSVDSPIAADSGKGFNAFNKDNVCIGGIDADDGYMMMTRTETQEISDTLSEALDDAEPYTREQIEAQLKELTNNFTKPMGEGRCGFKEEAIYSVDILEKYYEEVDMDKNGAWYDITFAKPIINESKSIKESTDYKVKFFQVFEAPKSPKENGKMIGQRGTLDDANAFGKERVGEGNYVIKAVCDDGKTRYIDKDTKSDAYKMSNSMDEDNIILAAREQHGLKFGGLKEASYGGAFDIADDQYFTREDIENAAEEVINHITETFTEPYHLGGTWFENGQWIVNVQGENFDEYEVSLPVDMRRIKEPWHLKRAYASDMAAKLIAQIKEYNGMNEDMVTSSRYEFDDDVDDLTYYYDDEIFKNNLENDPYTEIASKQVPDSDGFMTDYTMYRNINDGTYAFIFGDKDIYTPDDGNFDWSCDTEAEAQEWFDNYNGFDESDDNDWMNEEVVGESPIIHKKGDGSYLVASENGDGYTAFNKSDVCIGHITASNENEAKSKFNSNQFDE